MNLSERDRRLIQRLVDLEGQAADLVARIVGSAGRRGAATSRRDLPEDSLVDLPEDSLVTPIRTLPDGALVLRLRVMPTRHEDLRYALDEIDAYARDLLHDEGDASDAELAYSAEALAEVALSLALYFHRRNGAVRQRRGGARLPM